VVLFARESPEGAVHAVPAAVTYVDDNLDLPLPAPDFADRVHALSAAAVSRSACRDRRADPLPQRPRGATVSQWAHHTERRGVDV
jgi:hypothetical protein